MWKAEYMCCLWVQRMYVSIRKCLLNEQEVSSLQEKQQNINGRSENRLQTHTAQNSFNHVVYDCELDVGSHGSISPLSDKKGNYIKLDAAVRLESLDISFPYADTDWGGSWGGSPHSFFFFPPFIGSVFLTGSLQVGIGVRGREMHFRVLCVLTWQAATDAYSRSGNGKSAHIHSDHVLDTNT